MLTTMSFIGLFVGVTSSGYFADVFGRRLPCIIAYGTTFLCLLLCSSLQSWAAITIAGFGAGFGTGFGMPASVAMLSEMTPASWRIPMRAATTTQYGVGMVYVCVLAGMDDESLVHLNWRMVLWSAAIPCATLCVLSAAFLPESPVFLATKGLEKEAECGFRSFARRNGRSISGAYELKENGNKTVLSFMKQLSVIFSHRYWFATVACIYASFCINLTMYGGLYGGPQIFVTTSSLPAAWQTLMSAIPGSVAVILTGFVADGVSRKMLIVLSLAISFTAMLGTVTGGSQPIPRTWHLEALYQYGTLFGAVGAAIGFTALFQLAVEIYPPTSSATGASVIIGIGRIGAIIAPGLFELMKAEFGNWQVFYSCVGLCSLVCILMWMFVPASIGLARPIDDDDLNQKLAGLGSSNHTYSTLEKSEAKAV